MFSVCTVREGGAVSGLEQVPTKHISSFYTKRRVEEEKRLKGTALIVDENLKSGWVPCTYYGEWTHIELF